MNLTGRVALVTGASQGIGRACALKLAQCGASVALLARNQQKLEDVAQEVTVVARAGTPVPPGLEDVGGTGVPARAFVADVGNEDQIKSVFKAVLAEFGKIDILVANAGITRDNLFVQLRDEDWDEVINVNLTATFRLARAATKLMMRKRFGRIIAVTSVVGVTGNPGQGNYTASKAGLIGLTMAVAREVGSRNITCNAVAPGFIETAMTSGLSDEMKQTALKMIPLNRIGAPEDVANCVAFLASEEAGYISGHVLNVNGGMLMG